MDLYAQANKAPADRAPNNLPQQMAEAKAKEARAKAEAKARADKAAAEAKAQAKARAQAEAQARSQSADRRGRRTTLSPDPEPEPEFMADWTMSGPDEAARARTAASALVPAGQSPPSSLPTDGWGRYHMSERFSGVRHWCSAPLIPLRGFGLPNWNPLESQSRPSEPTQMGMVIVVIIIVIVIITVIIIIVTVIVIVIIMVIIIIVVIIIVIIIVGLSR